MNGPERPFNGASVGSRRPKSRESCWREVWWTRTSWTCRRTSDPTSSTIEVKSISSENTFPQDTDDRPTLRNCLREQAAEIAAKLERRRLAAHTVQVKVQGRSLSSTRLKTLCR